MTMEAIILMILIVTMKIGNNSKSGHETEKTEQTLVKKNQ